MHVPTGNIHKINEEDSKDLLEMERQQLVALADNDVKKVTRMSKPRRKGWMRNQPCPCNSGKKFKRCCWEKYE